MKKKNKKRKSPYSGVKMTILTGLSVLAVLLLTITVASFIYSILWKAGIVDRINYKTVMLFDYALVCTCIGFLLSILIFHRPAAKMQKLFDAMDRIAHGDFTVRLYYRMKHEKLTNRTVEMFNNMAQQLESTETLSHDFINNFSHEFKTPIASINGFAKLLKDDKLPEEEKREYLDIIIQESERLSNLAINILTLSKLEQQTILTNKAEYNLSEQIRIIIGNLYPKWSARNLTIELEGEDVHICANKEMLDQVWINLLDNAIKFSPEGEEIRLNISEQQDSLQIILSNSCNTAPDSDINRIFDKFYQGDTSHATKGYGLGLPMVKRIIELHSGTINFSYQDDKAIFTIELPAEE